MTDEPHYSSTVPGIQSTRGYIDGVEYEDFENGPHTKVHLQVVICAVCYISTRGAVFMISGTNICPSGWTREYYGYLMAERHNRKGQSTFECVDINAEGLPGSGSTNTYGGIMMHVESKCENFLCPPYKKGQELTCAVCTR